MSNSKEDNKENEARQNQVKEYLKTLEFREIYSDLISSCVAVSYTHLTLPTRTRV